jgi:hypothetical protein
MLMPLVNAVTSWADLGASKPEQPANPFTRQARVPFAKRYQTATTPAKVAESQINDLVIRTGLTNIGANELKLALSVIEAEEVNSSTLPNKVREVVNCWRAEHDGPEEAARVHLMGRLPSVIHVENKLASARAAQMEAEQAGAELANAWRNFEELPARFEKVKGYLASVNQTLAELEAPTYDESIRQVLRQVIRMRIESSHLEDGRASRMVGQLPDLMLELHTVQAKKTVVEELRAEYSAELDRLHSENGRLAAMLGTEPHQLS